MASTSKLRPKEAKMFRDFGRALRKKFLAKKDAGKSGWDAPDWMEECREQLAAHLIKGDPLDVALFAAFLHYHGERTNA
jgi:hypothetical protein